jgi:hypothetical protein
VASVLSGALRVTQVIYEHQVAVSEIDAIEAIGAEAFGTVTGMTAES